MRSGKPRNIGSASDTTGYRVNALLDARSEAALGVLQAMWGDAGIAGTIKRCLVERAALECPKRLQSAVAEVMARRTAVAGKRRL